jgi:DNA polymerase sigma
MKRARAGRDPVSVEDWHQLPPWITGGEKPSSLADEMRCFARYAGLSDQEEAARKEVIKAANDLVQNCWPSVGGTRCNVFGSYGAGLSTFASDVDLCVYGQCGGRPVQTLDVFIFNDKRSLPTEFVQAESIPMASVPLLALTHANGVNIDLSFSSVGSCGIEQTAFLQAVQKDSPAFKETVLVLKFFLSQRDLDKAYHGGLSSFRMCVMLARHLELNRAGPTNSDPTRTAAGLLHFDPSDCGAQLLSFLDFYGTCCNVHSNTAHVIDPFLDACDILPRPHMQCVAYW